MDTVKLTDMTTEELRRAWGEAEHALTQVPVGTPEHTEALRLAAEYRDAYFARVETGGGTTALRIERLAEG